MIPTKTLTRFIREQEKLYPSSTGELSSLLTSIALGVKIISQIVATSGLKGLTGYTGKINVQGEETKILDEEADKILVDILSSSGHFGHLVSEERDAIIPVEQDVERGKYVVAFDPLDGSTNIGTNIPVGTIFSILRKTDAKSPSTEKDFLQSGRHVVAAGYAVYGSKTNFVYSCGRTVFGSGVFGFTLDPSIGEFILTEEDMHIPDKGNIFSFNEGNYNLLSQKDRDFIDTFKVDDKTKGMPYTGRYVGSLIADFDRTLRKGGIFLYPGNKRHPKGKLRLLYECIPLAFIIEQAGGIALSGETRILDIQPESIHQRSEFVVGSPTEMKWYMGR